MRPSLRFPDYDSLRRQVEAARRQSLTYTALTATAAPELPPGYATENEQILLGEGEQVFDIARQALQQWENCLLDWTHAFPVNTPIRPGDNFLVLFRMMGVWWTNCVRIVYTIDRPDVYAFACGTLNQHMESGERLFQVSMDADEKVFYKVRSFNKPHLWAMRLGYPLIRSAQMRFVREGLQRMQALVAHRAANAEKGIVTN